MQHAVAVVLGTVQRTMLLHEMVRPDSRVLVAVSGGADSVGLLGLLCLLRRKLDFEIVAGHVNHGLRGAASDADECCAAAAATQLGVNFVRADLCGRLAAGANLEARARELRYGCLRELAAAGRCESIATGHTRDDQAETLLSRLVRGAGGIGLGGIQPRRADGVIRPLIECSRSEVEHVARLLQLEYRLDASNRDPRYQRTHVRYRVLPLLAELNPTISRTLAGTARRLRTEARIVEEWTADQLSSIAPGEVLSAAALALLAPELREHVVYWWLLRAGVAKAQLSSRHVELVLRLAMCGSDNGSIDLPAGQQVLKHAGVLTLVAATPRARPVAPAPPQDLAPGGGISLPGGWRLQMERIAARDVRARLPSDLWSAVCDAAPPAGVRVRFPRPGDRVRPLGLGGGCKLSDVFVDRKVPRQDRSGYPVIEIDGEILWVPGVVRSEARRLTATTADVLLLRGDRASP